MILVSSCSCLCPTHWNQVFQVENEDVVGAAPTGDAPTTSEWSTILLPSKVRLILETWRYATESGPRFNIKTQGTHFHYMTEIPIIWDGSAHMMRCLYWDSCQNDNLRGVILATPFPDLVTYLEWFIQIFFKQLKHGWHCARVVRFTF